MVDSLLHIEFSLGCSLLFTPKTFPHLALFLLVAILATHSNSEIVGFGLFLVNPITTLITYKEV